MSDVTAAYVDLLRKGPDVPDHVRQGLLASGADAVEPLLALLGDPSVDVPGHPSQGQARRHAAGLLGVLGEASAISGLLDALLANRRHSDLVGVIARALAAIGGVTGPALERLEQADSEADQLMLLMVLASAGERDDRILAALRERLPTEPALVLPLVGRYGDPALAKDVGDVLLAAGLDGRVTALAVQTLQKLGVSHPLLEELGTKANAYAKTREAKDLVDRAEEVLKETLAEARFS